MNNANVVSRFKTESIALHPAGVWKFDKNGDKEAVDAVRKDLLPLEDHPNDNMLKHRIQDSGLLCVDRDGALYAEVVKIFPSIANTLTTTTTRDFKQHHYLAPPKGKVFPLIRKTKMIDGLDIITNGTVFEAHLLDDDTSCYAMNDKEIVRCTEAEYQYIVELSERASSKGLKDEDNLMSSVREDRASETSLRSDLISFIKEGQYGQLETRLCSGTFRENTFDDFKVKGQLHHFTLHILGILKTDPTVSRKLAYKFMRRFSDLIFKINLKNDEKELGLFEARFNSNHIKDSWNFDERLVDALKNKEQKMKQHEGQPLSLQMIKDIGIFEDIDPAGILPLHVRNIIFNKQVHLFHAPAGYLKSFTVVSVCNDINKEKFYFDFEYNPNLKAHCETNGFVYITPTSNFTELDDLLASGADMSNALLVFDSFSRLIKDGNNDETDTLRTVQKMSSLCHKLNATVIVIDHSTKKDKSADPKKYWNFKVGGNETGKYKDTGMVYLVQPKTFNKENWNDGVLLKVDRSRCAPHRYMYDIISFDGSDVFEYIDVKDDAKPTKKKTNFLMDEVA